MKIITVEIFKFKYIIRFHNTLFYWAFLVMSMPDNVFCLTGFMTFFPFQELSNSIVRNSEELFLRQTLLISYIFFDKIFLFSPLSVQEMLTGQRLCQSSSHNDAVLAALNQQRSDGILCDITLIAEEQKFHAHKAVLAACSDYFRVSAKLYFFLFFSFIIMILELSRRGRAGMV